MVQPKLWRLVLKKRESKFLQYQIKPGFHTAGCGPVFHRTATESFGRMNSFLSAALLAKIQWTFANSKIARKEEGEKLRVKGGKGLSDPERDIRIARKCLIAAAIITAINVALLILRFWLG